VCSVTNENEIIATFSRGYHEDKQRAAFCDYLGTIKELKVVPSMA